jgi:hypothetical protein
MSTDDHKKYADIINSLKHKIKDKTAHISELKGENRKLLKELKSDDKKKDKLKGLVMKLNAKIRHKDNIIAELKECVFNESFDMDTQSRHTKHRYTEQRRKYDTISQVSSISSSDSDSIFDMSSDSSCTKDIRDKLKRHKLKKRKARKAKYRGCESDGNVTSGDIHDNDRGHCSDSTLKTSVSHTIHHKFTYVDEPKSCDRCMVMRDKVDQLVEIIDVLQDEIDRTSDTYFSGVSRKSSSGSYTCSCCGNTNTINSTNTHTSYDDSDIGSILCEKLNDTITDSEPDKRYDNVINTLCMYCDTLEAKIDIDINEMIREHITSKDCALYGETVERIIDSLDIPVDYIKRYHDYESSYYTDHSKSHTTSHKSKTKSSSNASLHSVCSILSKPKSHVQNSIHNMSHGQSKSHMSKKSSKHMSYGFDDTCSRSSVDSNITVGSIVCGGIDRCKNYRCACKVHKRYKVLLKKLKECRIKNIKLQLKVDSLINKIEYLKKIKCAITFTGGMKLETIEAKFKYTPEYEIYFQCYGYPKDIMDIAKVDLQKISEIRAELRRNQEERKKLESICNTSYISSCSSLDHCEPCETYTPCETESPSNTPCNTSSTSSNIPCDVSSNDSNCHISNCDTASKTHGRDDTSTLTSSGSDIHFSDQS